jgi:hypothetical protein
MAAQHRDLVAMDEDLDLLRPLTLRLNTTTCGA